jgi:hypothetical protein
LQPDVGYSNVYCRHRGPDESTQEYEPLVWLHPVNCCAPYEGPEGHLNGPLENA